MTNYRNKRINIEMQNELKTYLENMTTNAAKHGIEIGIIVFRVDSTIGGTISGASIGTGDVAHYPQFYLKELEEMKKKITDYVARVDMLIGDLKKDSWGVDDEEC